jgi:hypothetical protein
MRRKIIEWLIARLLKNYHIAKNPPSGIKRPRKLPKIMPPQEGDNL